MFIAVEGPNGVGKTTIVGRLTETLSSRGREVVRTTEPTDTELGRLLRFAGQEISGPALALGVAADRMLHVQNEIVPALERGATVVSDRYVPSSLVLQRVDHLDVQWIWSINQFAPSPDLTIYLRQDVATLRERLAGRSRQSRMEAIGGPELETRYYDEAFDFLAERHWRQAQVDCRGLTADDVSGTVLELVDKLSSNA